MKSTHERWHGTVGGYTNHKCRCDDCRKAAVATHAAYMARRKASTPPKDVHGTSKGYSGWGCRCDRCRHYYGKAENLRRGSASDYTPSEIRLAARRAREDAERERKRNKRVSYDAAHYRTRRKRGKANEYPCEFCGIGAYHWALIATAPQILAGVCRRGKSRTWSKNPDDYRPLCVKCHKRYDRHVALYGACAENCTDTSHDPPEKPKRIFFREGGVCLNGHDITILGAVRVREYDGHNECVQCNRDRSKRYRAKKSGAPLVAVAETLPSMQ